MTQPTIGVKDKDGNDVTVFTINPNGRAAAADSQPVALSTEDKAVFGSTTDAPATSGDTTAWSVVALLKGIWKGLWERFTGIAQGSSTAMLTASGPTNFVVDAANSMATTVGAGVEWNVAGTPTSILAAPEVAVLVKTDQNGTLTLRQFIDAAGASPLRPLTFAVVAGTNFGATIPLAGNYLRVTFTNNAGVTANVTVDTQYGTMPVTDEYGRTPISAPDGSQITLGAKADAANSDSTSAWSVVALLKGIWAKLPAVGIAAAAASQPVVFCNRLNVAGPTGQSVINTDLLTGTVSGWYDAQGFNSGSIDIVTTAGIGAGVVSFEETNDTTLNAAGTILTAYDTVTSPFLVTSLTLAASTTKSFRFAINKRYIRFRISTGVTGGTVAATAELSQLPYAHNSVGVFQATAANLNMTVGGGTLPTVTTVTTVTTLTGTTTLTPGTGGTNLGKGEDAAHASGDVGMMALGVRQDTPPTTAATSANGDYGFIALGKWNEVMVQDLMRRALTFDASATVTLAATPTDVALISGSATKTVFVKKIILSGVQTTGAPVEVLIIKRSTADTTGTPVAMTAVPRDSANAAATATPISTYTANPGGLGTAVGTVRREYIMFPTAASGVPGTKEFVFGDGDQMVTLNGVAQQLCVNLNGVTVTGGQLCVTFVFQEI